MDELKRSTNMDLGIQHRGTVSDLSSGVLQTHQAL